MKLYYESPKKLLSLLLSILTFTANKNMLTWEYNTFLCCKVTLAQAILPKISVLISLNYPSACPLRVSTDFILEVLAWWMVHLTMMIQGVRYGQICTRRNHWYEDENSGEMLMMKQILGLSAKLRIYWNKLKSSMMVTVWMSIVLPRRSPELGMLTIVGSWRNAHWCKVIDDYIWIQNTTRITGLWLEFCSWWRVC